MKIALNVERHLMYSPLLPGYLMEVKISAPKKNIHAWVEIE
jgi:hypothetical protein